MKIGGYSFRISLRLLKQGGMGLLDDLSVHVACLGKYDGVINLLAGIIRL